jgi:hypothetical protein
VLTKQKKRMSLLVAAFGLGVAAAALSPGPAFGFTQGVTHGQSVVPMGHEWITRQAAIEVLGGERALPADPKDPRKGWRPDARAADTGIGSAQAEVNRIRAQIIPKGSDLPFAATYKPVLDAILGERWVDIGGVNLGEARLFDTIDCLDAVTQEPPDVQYDHFMRKPSDLDGEGGVRAANESTQRFIRYFVAAAMAPDGTLNAWDGGGWSVLNAVDGHYFLFGRALHLFEDSFSPDHTVRVDEDKYRKVRQVKAYLCASGSEQHAHASPIHNPSQFYGSGDVIWRSMSGKAGAEDWSAYVPSNMRDYALAATEGTKDAWAAFIRTMAQPRTMREAFARKEAQKVAARWMAFDEAELRRWYSDPVHRKETYVRASHEHVSEDGGKGQTIEQCMARDWKGASQAKQLADFAERRRTCLYNMLPAAEGGEVDGSLRLAFDWKWRNRAKLEAPPKDWQVDKPRLQTVQVQLANRVNQTYMRQESGYIYNDPVVNPQNVTFDVTYAPGIPLSQNVIRFAVNAEPGKFLSRAGTSWGLVGIYSGDGKGHFSLDRRADGYYGIKNVDDNQWMYMHSDAKTYINRDGDPQKADGQWRVDGLRVPYLVSGTYTTTLRGVRKAVNLQSVNGKDWKLVVGPNGFEGTMYLERQSDGSYLIRINVPKGIYVRENEDHTLGGEEMKGGTRFYLQQSQDDGQFEIRTAEGRYWSTNPKVSGTPVTTIDIQSCQWNPCLNPISFGGEFGPGEWKEAAAAPMPPPPGCAEPSPQCAMPQVFSFTRDWKAK